VLELAGLRLNASCNSFGEPIITAETTVQNAQINVFDTVGQSIEEGSSQDLDPGDVFDVLVASTRGNGNVVYSRSDGTVVTVVFAFGDLPTYGTEEVCSVVGTALQG
jgi:hypothetical protein